MLRKKGLMENGEADYLMVARQGPQRHLNTRRLLPGEWRLVEVTIVERGDTRLLVEIKPLGTPDVSNA